MYIVSKTAKLSTLSITTIMLMTACSTNSINSASTTQEQNANNVSSDIAPLVKEEVHVEVSRESLSEDKEMVVAVAHERVLMKQKMAPGSANVRKIAPMPSHMPPKNDNENYQKNRQNTVKSTAEAAIATFSIDTDTGAYANVRRFLQDGRLPPADAVRYEELINYFNYDFNGKKLNNSPFNVSLETVQAPWKNSNRIIKVAIKSVDDITNGSKSKLPPSNLVFLVDVSGSMSSPDKLDMAKASLKMLTKQLRAEDTISLITYAGNTEITLPATSGKDTAKILKAIDQLDANGSTNGESAIKLAYQQAQENFKKQGINRILMLTDGDFNVGVSNTNEMLEIIKKNRDDGVSLSTFGFGTGNYNEHMMEQVANNGNGNYSYIDSVSEAKKALIDEMSATFNTVAKDVKVQVEFNPNSISEWRLIGYENRVLATEDFNNDKVDAGELGAGKSVVALFEVTPKGSEGYLPTSRYKESASQTAVTKSDELGYLKIRYKEPNGKTSKLIEMPISTQVSQPSKELNFAMAVAGYGQLLKDSKYSGNWSYTEVADYAKKGMNSDPLGVRHEFLNLVDLADSL